MKLNKFTKFSVAFLSTITLGTLALTTAANADETYTVKSGDTLSGIEYNFKKDANYQGLANDNNISNVNLIYVGQKLVIKSDSASTTSTTPAASSQSTQTNQNTQSSAQSSQNNAQSSSASTQQSAQTTQSTTQSQSSNTQSTNTKSSASTSTTSTTSGSDSSAMTHQLRLGLLSKNQVAHTQLLTANTLVNIN